MPAVLSSRPKLEVVVKALIEREQMDAIQAIARTRQLKTSDIVREALRFYLLHAPEVTMLFPTAGEQP